jgi:hypothetical protein
MFFTLSGIDQIPVQLIQAGCSTMFQDIQVQGRLPQQWKEWIMYQFLRQVIKWTVVILKVYKLLATQKIVSSILSSRLSLYVDEITWDHDVDSCLTDSTMYDNIIHLSNT